MKFLKKIFQQSDQEDLDQAWLFMALGELQAIGYGQEVPDLLREWPETGTRREVYAN
ncbi:hypothetical protein [Streptococcus sobrinus]|uniref:Uncharacterized protein n=1 Tax=Streptococcus sobrinus W1703 TaxID=1227275 RepID=U2KAT5_9STRE|nr:hypothetical protein [Streptococcus sobrinus]ERJ74284.1 hypothetical protein HMPREF1557_01781 [Streptococcus sobrinus W1703]SQG13607.1 Uncharacterised protein [Streptococcus sobrinus]SQG19974.1 Uncharacterised protein [Streptococcus sobrinus]